MPSMTPQILLYGLAAVLVIVGWFPAEAPDMLASVLGQRCLVCGGEIMVVVQHLTGRRNVKTTEDVEQRRLATPRRTEEHDEL